MSGPQDHRDKTPRQRPWTTAEVALLRRVADTGAEEAAETLGRSVRSVRTAAARHRISLRRKGERRGLLLGQPRGVALDQLEQLGDLRALVLDGRYDAERIARRVKLLADDRLCPACGLRPQEVEAVGLCRVCYLARFTLAAAIEADVIAAERALERERQRKARARRGRSASGVPA